MYVYYTRSRAPNKALNKALVDNNRLPLNGIQVLPSYSCAVFCLEWPGSEAAPFWINTALLFGLTQGPY